MSKALYFVAFAVGTAIGSAATWYVTKTKYEQLAQEEIDSVKAVFGKSRPIDICEDEPEEEETDDPEEDGPSVMEYAAMLQKEAYTNYSNGVASTLEDINRDIMEAEKPYVIPPEEFGELDDYRKVCLTYYADRMLADDRDNLVEDVDDVVGLESLNTFGQYEEDSVFVRNDRLMCDYEILMSLKTYSEVVKSKPYLAEG